MGPGVPSMPRLPRIPHPLSMTSLPAPSWRGRRQGSGEQGRREGGNKGHACICRYADTMGESRSHVQDATGQAGIARLDVGFALGKGFPPRLQALQVGS
jgi:hypothetical protein